MNSENMSLLVNNIFSTLCTCVLRHNGKNRRCIIFEKILLYFAKILERKKVCFMSVRFSFSFKMEIGETQCKGLAFN